MNSLEKDLPIDFPSYRIGAQVHDHEARIRLLERDSADIKRTLESMKDTIDNLGRDMDTKFALTESHIRADLSAHTQDEYKNQAKIMAYLITILLSVIGSGAYVILQKVMVLP